MAISLTKSSKEFQTLVLSALMKDAFIYAKVADKLDESFFESYSMKIIYSSLVYYHTKYSKLPSSVELLNIIIDRFNTSLGNLADTKALVMKLYDNKMYDDKYIQDSITKFIRRGNVEKVLREYIPKLSDSSDESAIDDLGGKLRDSLAFTLKNQESYNLADTGKIGQIRKEAIGTDENPIVIKSFIPEINHSLQFKGYKPGDVVMICLTGKTKVMTYTGEPMTIEELYNLQRHMLKTMVISYNKDNLDSDSECCAIPTMYEKVELTNYVHDTISITTNYGEVIECTPEHKFMLEDGSYIEAKDLRLNDRLATVVHNYIDVGDKRYIELRDKNKSILLSYLKKDSKGQYDSLKFISKSFNLKEFENCAMNYLDKTTDEFLDELSTKRDQEIIDNVGMENIREIYRRSTLTEIIHKMKKSDDVVRVVNISTNHYAKAIPVYTLVNVDHYHNYALYVGRNQNNERVGMISKNCSPPGCLLGDSKILLQDGSKISIEELYELYPYDEKHMSDKYRIISADPLSKGVLIASGFAGVKKTRYENVIMTITINGVYDIKCTRDHLFMLDNGRYIEARKLKSGDGLRLVDTSSGVPISYLDGSEAVVTDVRLHVGDFVPVYDLIGCEIFENYTVMYSETAGVISHNCGKTMFMINEGASAAKQGFKVLHIFLGDMKEYDGFIRYTSNLSGVPQDDIVAMSVKDQIELVKKTNLTGYYNNIYMVAHAAGEITAEEMIQEIKIIQNENNVHFDMILVDYADNLVPESTMMYESGGEIYNKLSALGFNNKSIILVGSQPKPFYWGEEIIPKEGAAESSKKQHVIDLMITMNRSSKQSAYGSIFLPKVRRGKECVLIRMKFEYEKAALRSIPETEYLAGKNSEVKA